MITSVNIGNKQHFSFLVDEYKKLYLNEHKDEIVIYCDLDCFPIAPFDNFILPMDAKLKPHNEWVKNNHFNKHIYPKAMGCNYFNDEKYREIMPDIWCLVNNQQFLNWHFIQLHKGSVLDDTLIIHNGMFMNESAIPEFNERTKAFHEMKIELGNNFCLPKYTPIEHYYSFERNTLNKDIKA